MAEDVNRQEEAQQEPPADSQAGDGGASDILDQVDDEVEELEDEQIEWTEDMMPKFETPPSAEPEQAQTDAEQDPVGLQPAEESQSNGETHEGDGPVSGDLDQASETQEHEEEAGSSTSEGGPSEGVEAVRFPQFAPRPKGQALGNLDLLLDVRMPLVVELGRSRMLIRDILELGPGSVIELDRAAGEPVDLLVNGKLIARGEVVVIDENFGLRITELADSVPEVAQ